MTVTVALRLFDRLGSSARGLGTMVIHHESPILARGNTSDVYEWGTGAVVKVLRPGIPDEWAAREAETSALVHAAGLPAPRVLELTTVGGRPSIVFEHVAGTSMWKRMLSDPRDIPRLARQLAELQFEINATPSPAGIPKLVDRLASNIRKVGTISEAEAQGVLDGLTGVPHEPTLCHFDVHPGNVLMADGGPMIIDWFDAATGGSAPDIVRSSVLMRRDAASCHLPCPDPSVIDEVHEHYLSAVTSMRDLDHSLLLAWQPAVTLSRLSEPIPSEMRRASARAWDELKLTGSSRLVASLVAIGG